MPRKTTACAAAVAVAAALVGLAGCSSDTERKETRSFEFSGKELTVETREAGLRIETGKGGAITVERSLQGDATDDGAATWSLSGGTLKLAVECSGISTKCSAQHTVQVPKGIAVQIKGSGSPVHVDALVADLTAALRADSSLRVANPTGKLRLDCAGCNINVTGARSPDVAAKSSADGNVRLSFAAPPSRVEARSAGGSVNVTLPKGPETYRIDTSGKLGPSVTSNPKSNRTVVAQSRDGRATVNKAG